MESIFNYKEFLEDYCQETWGCLVCNNSKKCKQDCNFSLNLEKLFEQVNDNLDLYGSDIKFNIEDYAEKE